MINWENIGRISMFPYSDMNNYNNPDLYKIHYGSYVPSTQQTVVNLVDPKHIHDTKIRNYLSIGKLGKLIANKQSSSRSSSPFVPRNRQAGKNYSIHGFCLGFLMTSKRYYLLLGAVLKYLVMIFAIMHVKIFPNGSGID